LSNSIKRYDFGCCGFLLLVEAIKLRLKMRNESYLAVKEYREALKRVEQKEKNGVEENYLEIN
jgi:hypothetical protein